MDLQALFCDQQTNKEKNNMLSGVRSVNLDIAIWREQKQRFHSFVKIFGGGYQISANYSQAV